MSSAVAPELMDPCRTTVLPVVCDRGSFGRLAAACAISALAAVLIVTLIVAAYALGNTRRGGERYPEPVIVTIPVAVTPVATLAQLPPGFSLPPTS